MYSPMVMNHILIKILEPVLMHFKKMLFRFTTQMNSLDALLRVCERVRTPGESLLEAYKPKMFDYKIAGRSVADIGCDPILHMRHFQVRGNVCGCTCLADVDIALTNRRQRVGRGYDIHVL